MWPLRKKTIKDPVGDRGETIQFIFHSLTNQPDVVRVRYNCECGCKPSVDYQREANEVGYEHCCCGRVHFVGPNADEGLRLYLDERRARGEDADMSYTFYRAEVKAPWGKTIPVAYAVPKVPRPH